MTDILSAAIAALPQRNGAGDMLALLPDEARARLERHRADMEAARVAYAAAADAAQDVGAELARLTAGASDPHHAPSGFQKRLIAEAQRRHDAAREAAERARSRVAGYAFVTRIEQWLTGSDHGGRFIFLNTPAPRAKDLRAEVIRIRAEIEAIEGKFQAAEDAPATVAEIRAKAVAEIDALAQRGALSISPSTRSDKPLAFARRFAGRSAGDIPTGDGGASLIAWLLRDAILNRVDAELSNIPQAGALSFDQREAEIARLSVLRLDLERAEEAAIAAAEMSGQSIPRRPDADPRAILGLET